MGFEPHDLRVMRGLVIELAIFGVLDSLKIIEIEYLNLKNYIAELNVHISITLSWGQNGVRFFVLNNIVYFVIIIFFYVYKYC